MLLPMHAHNTFAQMAELYGKVARSPLDKAQEGLMPYNRQDLLFPLELHEMVHQAINLHKQTSSSRQIAITTLTLLVLVGSEDPGQECQSGEVLPTGHGRAEWSRVGQLQKLTAIYSAGCRQHIPLLPLCHMQAMIILSCSSSADPVAV